MSIEKFEILVVDDNPNNLKLVRKLLSEKEFKVRIATSGEMALKSVQSSLPDLILLDITMPGLSGFETCEKLKEDQRTKDIPVIFLSALKEESDIVKGFEVGGVDFVTKPFKSEILLARINTHTALYSLKQDLREKNRTLEKNFKELQEAQDQLIRSQKMAALGNMVKGVSHELNTPIGVSITGVSFLKTEAERMIESMTNGTMTKSDLTEYFYETDNLGKSILISLQKAAELVKFFKQVSVEQHQDTVAEFNVFENFDDIIKSFKHTFKHKDIQIHNEIPKNITITSYPGVFYQIYTNLLNNAHLHAFDQSDQGKISIHAELAPEKLTIKVTDDGKGMAPEVKQKLFDAFFTTKRGQGGTGLGMSIVYTLITEKLSGSVEVESEVDKGTSFTISIPNRSPVL